MHPAGHFFAVGYSDGSIAFWAVEDEDQPLLVRTTDEIDVNFVDGEKLEKSLPQAHTEKASTPPQYVEREPIFKLSWSSFPNSSDPRGGGTALTILGGLNNSAPGVTVHWLPAFNPPEPPASPDLPSGLHPFTRNAMRESLMPSKTYFYNVTGITQDFLLVPRDNPHFSGSFDPIAILFLSDSQGDTRVIDAYDFPPPTFSAVTPVELVPVENLEVLEPRAESHSDALAEDLASTLQAMKMDEAPRRLRLPPPLSNGIIDGRLVKLERDAYERLSTQGGANNEDLPLHGGLAWADESKTKEMKLSKVCCRHFLFFLLFISVASFNPIAYSSQLTATSPSNFMTSARSC
jgi:hypothetical protein